MSTTNATIPAQRDAAGSAQFRPLVRIVIVGHVDHGKSTLIGRLLYETGSLPDGKVETLKAVSARRGMPFEWSFLLDALQAERDQGVTIDTSQIRFRTPSRDFVLIDAPGHTEFLRNMITGASQADAALLIIDAKEGVRDQTRRHGYLLHLLGIRQLAVVINKMDQVGYEQARFAELEREIATCLDDLGLTPTAVIPISARDGDGVAQRTPAIAWHSGPTVLEALDAYAPRRPVTGLALRLPVQAVYKFDDRRIVAGRIESGGIAVGDEVLVLPSGRRSRVKSIETWPDTEQGATPAVAGRSIGITLADALFIERGSVVCGVAAPAGARTNLSARIFWLHALPLQAGARVRVRIGTAEAAGVVTAVADALDPGRLTWTEARSIGQNQVGKIDIALDRPVACDPYDANPAIGRMAIELGGRIAGGGLLLAPDSDETAAAPARAQQAARALDAQAVRLSETMAELSPADRIARLRHEVSGRIVFTTRFEPEDQMILHWLCAGRHEIEVVTLDTGGLLPETYELWAETERRYGRRIRAIYPNHSDLEALVARYGINGLYESGDAHAACHAVRIVEPLNRALDGASAWITGPSGDLSVPQKMSIVEVDADRSLLKLNPLLSWTREAILRFALDHGVPSNSARSQGSASAGERRRAGRWWWEAENNKACGPDDRPEKK